MSENLNKIFDLFFNKLFITSASMKLKKEKAMAENRNRL